MDDGADPLFVQADAVINQKLDSILAALGQLALLQQQLAVIERQLDGVTVLVSRSFTATLSPEARAEERRQATELAQRIAKEKEEELNKIIASRNARGIPDDGDAVTLEDLEDAERESFYQ